MNRKNTIDAIIKITLVLLLSCFSFFAYADDHEKILKKVKLFFNLSLNNFSHGYILHKKNNFYFEEFAVNPGDCSANKFWSDCENDRERSEIKSEFQSDLNGVFFYSWYLYVPNDTPDLYPAKTYFGQFHQRHGAPNFLFRYKNNSLYIERQIGDLYESKILIDEKNLKNKWIRVDVVVNWDECCGFFEIYIDGINKYSYYGVTKNKNEIFLKYGIYRSHISRLYKKYPDAYLSSAQTIYYSCVAVKKIEPNNIIVQNNNLLLDIVGYLVKNNECILNFSQNDEALKPEKHRPTSE